MSVTAAQFGATWASLATRLEGVDTRLLGPDTAPLSTTQMTQFLDDAAATLANTLRHVGRLGSADSVADVLTAEEQKELSVLLYAYGRAKCMAALRFTGPRYDVPWREWETGLKMLRSSPSVTVTSGAPRITHNIPQNSTRSRFRGRNWQA